MEPFNIGLDREDIKTSPNLENLPSEPPKKKTCHKMSSLESL